MPSPLPYYNHYTADWAASTTVRLMGCAARGIYRELLDIQWEKECLADDLVKLKRLARATDAEWDEFAEFLDECFPLCDDGCRRNPRMDSDRRAAVAKVEKNRESGSKGGRPTKPSENRTVIETKPNGSENENPKETERLSDSKPTRNRTVSQTITQTKAISESESESESESDITETKVSGEIAGEKNLESKNGKVPNAAWSEVSEILGLVCESLGWDPPIEKDIRRNLKPDSALRQLAKLVGATEAADLFVYACREWKGHVSWEAVFDKRNLILDELKGREYSRESELPKHVRNRKEPMAGVDFYMGYAGESPVGGVMLRPFAIIADERTQTPFDARWWFESRNLKLPEKYKQLMEVS